MLCYRKYRAILTAFDVQWSRKYLLSFNCGWESKGGSFLIKIGAQTYTSAFAEKLLRARISTYLDSIEHYIHAVCRLLLRQAEAFLTRLVALSLSKMIRVVVVLMIISRKWKTRIFDSLKRSRLETLMNGRWQDGQCTQTHVVTDKAHVYKSVHFKLCLLQMLHIVVVRSGKHWVADRLCGFVATILFFSTWANEFLYETSYAVSATVYPQRRAFVLWVQPNRNQRDLRMFYTNSPCLMQKLIRCAQ